MKTLKIAFLSLVLAFAASCKSKHSSDPAAPGASGYSDVIVELKYYRGGWFGPTPNWSHDMTIDFLTYSNGQYKVTAKDTDPLCFKTGGITVAEVNSLITLYSQMLLNTAGDIVLPDLGNEYIQIKTSTGIIRKFHLITGNVPKGEIYVTNPDAIRDFLQDLEASLAVACI